MSPPNPSFCCRFATAERRTLASSRAMILRVNCNVASAWFTLLPRMRSQTRPAFCAEVRTPRAVACASTIAIHLSLGWRSRSRSRRGGRLLRLRRMPLERPRWRKLAKLVADHVLGDVHRNELLAVVHRHRVPHHLRHDGRAARPGLDDLLLVGPVHLLDLLEKRGIDERPLLQ